MTAGLKAGLGRSDTLYRLYKTYVQAKIPLQEAGMNGAVGELETHIGLSKAREKLSRLLDRVVDGGVRVIDRRDDRVALVDAGIMDQLLAKAFPFSPEVYFDGDSGAAIWLPELEVGAEGDDLDSAEDALVSAVLDYASSWEAELKQAPNHADRAGWVYRLELAGRPERIRELIFAEHEAPDIRRAPSLL